MTYQEFTQLKASYENLMTETGKILRAYPTCSMGMTLDSAKDDQWRSARQTYASAKTALDRLYKANKTHYKTMLNQSRVERDAKRSAILASQNAA